MHTICGNIVVEIVWVALLIEIRLERKSTEPDLPYSNASRSVPRGNDLRAVSTPVLADELTSI